MSGASLQIEWHLLGEPRAQNRFGYMKVSKGESQPKIAAEIRLLNSLHALAINSCGDPPC